MLKVNNLAGARQHWQWLQWGRQEPGQLWIIRVSGVWEVNYWEWPEKTVRPENKRSGSYLPGPQVQTTSTSIKFCVHSNTLIHIFRTSLCLLPIIRCEGAHSALWNARNYIIFKNISDSIKVRQWVSVWSQIFLNVFPLVSDSSLSRTWWRTSRRSSLPWRSCWVWTTMSTSQVSSFVSVNSFLVKTMIFSLFDMVKRSADWGSGTFTTRITRIKIIIIIISC